jgi:hypothetical protein
MKRNHIAKIAALRANLNRYAYRHDSMVEYIKDYLGDDLTFEIRDTVNHRGHAAKEITIFDKQGDTREIIAEYCAEADEFNFAKIGVGERLYDSISELALGIKNINRINSKQARIVPITLTVDGCWQFWKILVSYHTIIAAWKITGNVIYLQPNARKYSNTTNRHLSDFVCQVSDELKVKGEKAILKYASFKA